MIATNCVTRQKKLLRIQNKGIIGENNSKVRNFFYDLEDFENYIAYDCKLDELI